MSEDARAGADASRRANQSKQENSSGSVTVKRDIPLSFSKLSGIVVDLGGVGFDDVSSYLNANLSVDLSLGLTREPGPASNLYLKTNPELNKKGCRIAWVEHAKTGELVPVVLQGGVAVKDVDAENGERNDNIQESAHGDDDDSPTMLLLPKPLTGVDSGLDRLEGGQMFPGGPSSSSSARSYAESISLVRSAFLFSQGLLAGFCFTTICTESAAVSDVDFLTSYQPNAMQSRRLFYFLCTLSLVGSLDTMMTIISRVSQQMPSRQSQSDRGIDAVDGAGFFTSLLRALGSSRDGVTVVVAILVSIIHGITFLSTVIMAKVDEIIAVRGGAGPSSPNAEWSSALLAVDGFETQLSSWHTLNQVRLVTAMVAWLGCCFLAWKTLSAVENKNDEVTWLKAALLEWQHRLNLMEGNSGLDGLNPQELAKLVALQKVGLDRAQEALKTARETSKTAAAAGAGLDSSNV